MRENIAYLLFYIDAFISVFSIGKVINAVILAMGVGSWICVSSSIIQQNKEIQHTMTTYNKTILVIIFYYLSLFAKCSLLTQQTTILMTTATTMWGSNELS